jgi:hypothetical protein
MNFFMMSDLIKIATPLNQTHNNARIKRHANELYTQISVARKHKPLPHLDFQTWRQQ